MNLKSKVLKKHSKNCFAVEAVQRGTWKTPWTGIVEYNFYGDCMARKNGSSTLWNVINCNDPNCPALKAIRADVLCHA